MGWGHRSVASAVAVAVATSVVALPVITGPQAAIRPVTPVVTQVALTGIDPAGLSTSIAPVSEIDPVPTSRVNLATVLSPAVATVATITTPFTLVGVDWTGTTPAGTTVQVRVHENGAWSDWSRLDVVADHGPDSDSVEAQDVSLRTGTEPLMTAPGSDGVQVRIDSVGGRRPTDAKITLVDPQSSPADATAEPTPPSTAQAAGDPLRPAIITRAQWGADESLRSRGPIYTGPVKVGFVHHTASTSSYTPAQSTAQMRALYAWYTLGLHYSDLAYNVLVDRYGRLYEGRAGGLDRNVLGGHTAGFNQNTFAVSAIGNFDTYNPPASAADAIVTAIAKLMAWKLALNHRDPMGTATLVSDSAAGTSRYAVGQKATVPVISGHRDIGSTACPGRYLEQYVPRIRALAKTLMGTQLLNPVVAPSVVPYAGTGPTLTATTTAAVSWKLEVFSICQDAPVRVLSGTQKSAGALAIAWDQKRSDGRPALPGTYRLVLSASHGAQQAYPAELRSVITATATSPLGPCAQAARLASTERYAAAVETGRLVAPTSRTVVLAPGDDAGLPEALLAAPLAAVKAAPRLLTTPSSLPAVVAADITARKVTTVYLVGSATQITPAVETALRARGVTTIVRLVGVDRASTAGAVADAMGVTGSAVGVSFDAGSSLDLATVAAADAAAAGRPLLVLGPATLPAATIAAVARLSITSVVVVAPRAQASDAVVASLPAGVRVAGADDATTSRALADLLAPSAARVMVTKVGAVGWRAVAAGALRPVLLTTSSTSTTPVVTWIAAHADVIQVLAVGTWGDSALAAFASSIGTRTSVTPPPPTPPTPGTPPAPQPPAVLVVPASFSFSGSGFGHGVGLSQYGARGMALEGFTGTQIAQHYYTGTTVAPVADTANIRVNIAHLSPTVVLRTESLAAKGGGVEVTVAGKLPVVGGVTDVFTVTAKAGVVTVRRTGKGGTTTVGTGRDVSIRWAGTRSPGKAGTGATLLDVASTVTGLKSSGHRYRYGTVDIAATAASPNTLEVVNSLRIHDEYLLGISEMSSSWPRSALQAQVLAARSYALSKYGTGGMRAACRCQVDSGKGPYFDQTFAGWAKESGPMGSAWRAAVFATIASASTGRAVLSGGRPITAFYFSASGGSTQSSQDVWVTPLAYVQSVDDHWSMDPSVPWSQWSPQVRTQVQVAAAFGLADVVRIDLSVRTAAGGVKVATAWSSKGVSSSITGEVLRTRLALPSTWVWRALESATGDPITSAVRVAAAVTSADVVIAPAASPVLMAVAQNLGAQKGWPVLLVQPTGVPTATRAELLRRRASRIHIVGTTADVPAAVVASLTALSPSVTRYAGATVSDVSVTVAGQLGLRTGTQAMVSSATDPLGSVLASATASASRRAFVVVPGGSRAAPAVATYLGALRPVRTSVVGSTASVASVIFAAWKGSVRVTGANSIEVSSNVLATLGATTPRRLVLTTSTGATRALLSAPGAPLVVVTTGLPATASGFLQRGITTIVSTPGVAAAVVTAARRA